MFVNEGRRANITLRTAAIAAVLVTGGLVGWIASARSATEAATTPVTAQPPAVAQPLLPTRLTALPSSTITDGTAALRVRLSGAPAAGSPRPMITPAVAGSWSTVGDSEIFKPASTLALCSTYRLTIWSATVAVAHASLGKRRTITLNVPCPPVRALQQALARLGYLPYEFRSSYGVHITAGAESRALAAHRAFSPPVGHLRATVRDAPTLAYGSLDATTRGALMVFQSAHKIQPTGIVEGHTWASLLASETLNSRDRSPYTFVTVSESSPEKLEVHQGNHVVLSTPANTGVVGAETATGTFPIFARYTSTTMVGTNPDGTHYNDPGVPWVNYFNGGDAVHGFERGSYGSPQSNGCVELPISTAHDVYRLLSIGDIVQING
jgi:peptidoglycan hydrolase-like protein with peptidoglycan-binding domain